MNRDHFRGFVKQKTSLSFCVVMAGLTEVFVFSNDALHWGKLSDGPLQSPQLGFRLWRDWRRKTIDSPSSLLFYSRLIKGKNLQETPELVTALKPAVETHPLRSRLGCWLGHPALGRWCHGSLPFSPWSSHIPDIESSELAGPGTAAPSGPDSLKQTRIHGSVVSAALG